MVLRRYAVAILAIGSVVLPAWGQALWAGAGFSPFPDGTVSAPTATTPAAATTNARTSTTAVAAFPDVVAPRPAPPRDEALDLLATSPYAAELAFREAQRNLFGDGLEDEDPYAEALRLVNPYTGTAATARTGSRPNPYTATRGHDLANPYAATATRGPDLANPYTASTLRGADLSNPYAR